MWAMLTEVAEQATHMGQRYTPDQWKILFMYACGREVQFLPGLDGKTFLPWGQSTSDLSKEEMSDLIEFIHAWGAENGVVFHGPEDNQDAQEGPSGHQPAANDETRVSEAVSEEEQNPEAGRTIEASETPADQSPAGDEGGGEPPEQNPSPSSPDLVECCRKLLALAIDESIQPLGRRQALASVKDDWKARLPEADHDKLRSIFQSADAIIKGDTDFGAAVSFFSDALGVDEDELKE
jgi:hypothetical protein